MSLLRSDALALPLADGTVDLIVTSPPYFALRSYTDEGEHYPGQIGSEDTPQAFLEALWAATAEMVRVLKPSGSIWVNLGDKYSGGRGGYVVDGGGYDETASLSGARREAVPGFRPKTLLGLPWRYAIGCIDRLGLILRAEVIWAKPNGLPESVTDRVRRSHEQWFMFTKQPRYFSAVDEIREPHAPKTLTHRGGGQSWGYEECPDNNWGDPKVRRPDPLGKLPGSVWTIPTEPLRVPDGLPQHFAAFPSEWPRRIILGWSPSGVCTACGEGRRPEVDVERHGGRIRWETDVNALGAGVMPSGINAPGAHSQYSTSATITGYSCACHDTSAPTTPARVLDPFAGTGTVPAVASALGRHGIGVDLSADYLRLAAWRCQDPALRAKVLGVDKPKAEIAGQLDLLGGAA